MTHRPSIHTRGRDQKTEPEGEDGLDDETGKSWVPGWRSDLTLVKRGSQSSQAGVERREGRREAGRGEACTDGGDEKMAAVARWRLAPRSG